MDGYIIIHGGAWDIPQRLHNDHLQGLERALGLGLEKLQQTGDAHATCLFLLRAMEDDPVFDAGTGSFLNAEGEVEMDAGIMCGRDLSVGAVSALSRIKNPVLVAEAVRTRSQHTMLTGEGAVRFAIEQGFQTVPLNDLLTGRELERFQAMRRESRIRIKTFFEGRSPSDTVGAVVIDAQGHISAGATTGGTPFKRPGRVGDVPVAGAGFYADDEWGGVSVTGWGEGIFRAALSMRVIQGLEQGRSPEQAVNSALRFLKKRIKGEAGVIVLNRDGIPYWRCTTPYMAVAHASVKGPRYVRMVEGISDV